MRVPDTLMTSDPGAALAFIERHGIGGTIHKIFAATHQVWRETRLVRVEDVALLESVRLAPVIFQERIPAVADVRVTVVGDDVFPMAIDTRHTGTTWTSGSTWSARTRRPWRFPRTWWTSCTG
jgi:glutathione synthase/RimK-type ligase-like ATP-grasp enzyme